jgi:hypothetical protein
MTSRTRHNSSTTRLAPLLTGTMATTLVLGVLLVGLSITPRVAYAQKGKSAPPPPVVLPPARYMIQWLDGGPGWTSVLPQFINQTGGVAGNAFDQNSPTSFVFAHSAATGTFNVNDLGAIWWDLNAPTPTSVAGWRATFAKGINDQGDIAGTATQLNSNVPSRAFILQGAFGAAPRFLLLPTVSGESHYGGDINNHGEAIGGGPAFIRWQPRGDSWPFYVALPQSGMPSNAAVGINDDGVVVASTSGTTTTSYRQPFAGAQPVVFNNLQFFGISNGWISGISMKGKNPIPPGIIRLPAMGTLNDVQVIASFGSSPRGVNDYGDVTFESGGPGYLFYDAINANTGIRYGTNGDGLLPFDRMIVNPTADFLNNNCPRITGVSNRDATGLGVICGWTLATTPSRAFLLVPFVP